MSGWWDQVLDALRSDFSDLPNSVEAIRITVRLILAAVLGGVIGYEHTLARKEAGLRTHMLVAIGSAAFVLIPLQAGMRTEDLSRVIQGLLSGIGFIGAGAILKANHTERVYGLTTAAGLWLTAAVGMAAGTGRHSIACLTVLLAFVVLSALSRVEERMKSRTKPSESEAKSSPAP